MRGEKLIASTTAVFAHGSVRLDSREAAAIMQELRDRIRSPATRYKATHVLRSKHRAVLEWLLGQEPAARPGPGVPDRQDLLRAGVTRPARGGPDGRRTAALPGHPGHHRHPVPRGARGPSRSGRGSCWPAKQAHAPAVGGRPLLQLIEELYGVCPAGRSRSPGPTPSGSRAHRGVPGPGARRWPAAAGPAGPGHPAGRAHPGRLDPGHDRRQTEHAAGRPHRRVEPRCSRAAWPA